MPDKPQLAAYTRKQKNAGRAVLGTMCPELPRRLDGRDRDGSAVDSSTWLRSDPTCKFSTLIDINRRLGPAGAASGAYVRSSMCISSALTRTPASGKMLRYREV